MLDLKDKNLEWELIALTKQVQGILDEPDDMCMACPVCERFEEKIVDTYLSLYNRCSEEINVPRMGWGPIHDELTAYLLKLGLLMKDLNLLSILKKKKSIERRPSTDASKSIVAKLDEMIRLLVIDQ